MKIFQFILLLTLLPSLHGFLWLPFANLGSMFETLKQAAFPGKVDFAEPDSSYSILELGKEFFNTIGNFVTSSFGDDEKMSLATNLREIFNLTTAAPHKASRRILPKLIPVDKPVTTSTSTVPAPKQVFTLPYTTSRFVYTTTMTVPLPSLTTTYDPKPSFRFTTTTEPMIVKFIKTKKPVGTTEPTPENEIIRFTTDRTKFATFAPNIFPTMTPFELPATSTSTPVTTTTTFTTTTTSPPTTSTTEIPMPKPFTRPVYPIWPTTINPFYLATSEPPLFTKPRPTTEEVVTLKSIIRAKSWKKVTPSMIPELTRESFYTSPSPRSDVDTAEVSAQFTTQPMTPPAISTTTAEPTAPRTEAPARLVSSTAGIPRIIKSRTYTRPPVSEKIIQSMATMTSKRDTCVPGEKCQIRLKSFETSDPLFQYCYSHSTMINDSIQDLLRDTQTASLPNHIAWQQSVTPEAVQLMQTMMSLYQPSRCLVIGVFTGLGLLGVAEKVDSRGIVVALEHPAYSVFWENVGQKHSKKLSVAQMSRIQMRTSESIEKSLPRLAANEPNTFDFVLLDDFKRENYLDDYEHAVRLLRSGGLLMINQALNNGGVMSPIDYMTNDDRVIRNMNIRIKQDPRVSASLLPYGGGIWIITKN